VIRPQAHHAELCAICAKAFAHRAQQEVVAIGSPATAPLPDSLEALTPHEQRIALLVTEGASNPEDGER
jgi:DNA-binding NarL/FixJ family response regulator